MNQPQGAQEIIDNEHLKLLRIGYFISAGQTAFLIPFGIMYAGMGAMFANLPMAMPKPSPGAPGLPPEMFTWFFAVFGSVMTGFAVLGTTLKVLTAMRLKSRRSRTLCLVTAALSMIEIPYGTALGIFTFQVLGRASVRQQFDT